VRRGRAKLHGTPATVTIPAGQASATFTITALAATTAPSNWLFAAVGNSSLCSPLIGITPWCGDPKVGVVSSPSVCCVTCVVRTGPSTRELL
jgi:hypothetical protein